MQLNKIWLLMGRKHTHRQEKCFRSLVNLKNGQLYASSVVFLKKTREFDFQDMIV